MGVDVPGGGGTGGGGGGGCAHTIEVIEIKKRRSNTFFTG